MANKPCEDYPLVQNWNYIFADNAEEYLNDIIGHIFCESPRFRGSLDATTSQVSAGSSFDLTVTMSYDSVVPPPGKEISRFKLLRPRAYINYPEQWLTVTGIDKEDEAEDQEPEWVKPDIPPRLIEIMDAIDKLEGMESSGDTFFGKMKIIAKDMPNG